MTPQDNLNTILRVCREQNLGSYSTLCAVLTGYAESDYRSDAVDPTGSTFGVFQQNPRWWPTAHSDTEAQCKAFLNDFFSKAAKHNSDPVHDCWLTQLWWDASNPIPFEQYPSTINYRRRVDTAKLILQTGVIPKADG